LDCFLIFIDNESSKADAINLAVKSNVTEDLIKLGEIYKNNKDITRMVNQLIVMFAKELEDAATQISENRIVANILTTVKEKTGAQTVEDRQRNFEYLNTLADIPNAAEKIIQTEGIGFLQKYIKDECQRVPESKRHLVDADKIDEHIYELDLQVLELNENRV
jgi:hypothetical protein